MDAPQVSSPAADRTPDVGVSSAPSAPELLSESLANVGRELGADRVYVFENIRGPDGRLWMNLASEWLLNGNRGLFDAPGAKLHPYSPDFTRWITRRTPAGRWGRIEDVVGPALWLASDAADFVNGQVIYVDGGITAVI